VERTGGVRIDNEAGRANVRIGQRFDIEAASGKDAKGAGMVATTAERTERREAPVSPMVRNGREPRPIRAERNGAAVELAIEAVGLERRFGGFVAVDKVDLAVKRGEIYGFLGPNGAGKSTTTRMLCTLTAPTGGRATVAGHDVAREPDAVRLRIGAALQATALDNQQTGAELLRQ